MKEYKLKEHVTDGMLIKAGFRLMFDKDVRAIRTLESRSIFIENNSSVLAWREKDIQYLIDLDYVEVIQ